MYLKKNILFPLFFSSLFLFVFNFIAIKFHLYWTTNWVDIVSHFVGGIIVALGICFVFPSLLKQKRNLWTLVIGGTLLIGLTWEFFESYFKLVHPLEKGYVSDTLLDLFLDGLGSLFGLKFIINKTNEF